MMNISEKLCITKPDILGVFIHVYRIARNIDGEFILANLNKMPN